MGTEGSPLLQRRKSSSARAAAGPEVFAPEECGSQVWSGKLSSRHRYVVAPRLRLWFWEPQAASPEGPVPGEEQAGKLGVTFLVLRSTKDGSPLGRDSPVCSHWALMGNVSASFQGHPLSVGTLETLEAFF